MTHFVTNNLFYLQLYDIRNKYSTELTALELLLRFRLRRINEIYIFLHRFAQFKTFHQYLACIITGAPQGSSDGSSLYLYQRQCYDKEIVTFVEICINLYADDTALHYLRHYFWEASNLFNNRTANILHLTFKKLPLCCHTFIV